MFDINVGHQVDEALRTEDVEIYYDPAELFSGLLNGPLLSADHEQLESSRDNVAASTETTSTNRCPLH